MGLRLKPSAVGRTKPGGAWPNYVGLCAGAQDKCWSLSVEVSGMPFTCEVFRGTLPTMNRRLVRVFLASPGDVELERAAFYDSLPSLGTELNVELLPTGWELQLAQVGERPQALINRDVDCCDLFVALFHRRWGQASSDSVGSESYTEEEISRALRRYAATGAPRIVCFFKNIDVATLADPGPQLEKVLAYKRRLENSGKVLYRSFSKESEFVGLLSQHIRDYVKQAEIQMPTRRRILLPVPADEGMDTNRGRDVALANQAALSAAAGHLEEAEAMFAKLSQVTVTVPVLDIAKQFFDQIGNIDAAQAILDRKMAILRDRRLAAQEYIATMFTPGWLDAVVAGRLKHVPEDQRPILAAILRAAMGEHFHHILLEFLSENFTLGELRALAKFYGGDGATVAAKMTEFMGTLLPKIEARLQQKALEDPEVAKLIS